MLQPIFLALALAFLESRALAASAGTPGKVNLYDDWNCNVPSTITPTASLPLSVCLVTQDGYGLVVGDLPPCPTGVANIIFYQDAACGVITNNAITGLVAQNCYELAAGVGIFNARAVMFSCQPATDNPQPSSTSTVVVSAAAAVATGSPGGAASSASPASPSASPSSASNPGSSTTGPSTAQSSSAAASGSSPTLSTNDIIYIVVGVVVFCITAVSIYFGVRRNSQKRRRGLPYGGVPYHQDDKSQWQQPANGPPLGYSSPGAYHGPGSAYQSPVYDATRSNYASPTQQWGPNRSASPTVVGSHAVGPDDSISQVNVGPPASTTYRPEPSAWSELPRRYPD